MLHDPRSATIVCWHPALGSQLSVVQGSPSSQLSGVPAVQTPARHVSTPLQMLPSLHDASVHCGEVGVVVEVVGVTVAVGGGGVGGGVGGGGDTRGGGGGGGGAGGAVAHGPAALPWPAGPPPPVPS